MICFTHFNFNVLDLERSLKFYDDALGLKPAREIVPEDGSFKIVYLSDGKSDFTLELTWLRDCTEPYNTRRLHENLNYLTPMEFRKHWQKDVA